MNTATIIPRVKIERYNCNLGSSNTRINNRGLEWTFDAEISLFTQLQNTSLTVSLHSNKGSTIRHTELARINIEARFYFVENIGQPYAQVFVSGNTNGLPDEREISVGLYIFRRNSEYDRYIDLLRNEDPIYLKFVCDINEDQSHYRDTRFDLLPLEQLQIRGLSKVFLGTIGEEVGEGEEI